MLVNVSPKFDIGDQDILFVAKNGEAECLVVNCVNVRFRMIDGLMFNEYGQQVILSEKGQMKLGKVVVDSQFTSFKVGDVIYKQERHQSVSQDSKSYLDMTNVRKNSAFDQFDTDRFLSNVNDVLWTSMPKDPRGGRKMANNTNITKSSSFTPMKAERVQKITKLTRNISEKAMQQWSGCRKNVESDF